jgi:cytochrome c oxidase subunit 2
MLVPGQVSTATHTFREAGEYVVICHEYCGIGHQTMFGKVIAE